MTAYKQATLIIHKLREAGHIAYFAGGWVRDYLLGHPSSDVDIATSASPEIILKLFPKTKQVGLSFGVVIIVSGNHQFEISTFRKDLGYEDGRRPKEIAFSSAEEDALRRDFSINGLFYDPEQNLIIDYVGGQEDLKKGIIRTIGNPFERFQEDRLRMIRAVRFACRFKYSIDPSTRQAIQEQAHTLFPAVAMERIWQEFKKMTDFPGFDLALIEMHSLGLLPVIFPSLKKFSTEEISARVASFSRFPKHCPTILYLMELFPDASCNEQIAFCQYLKTSLQDQKLVEGLYRLRALIEKDNIEEAIWAEVYALEHISLFLEVASSKWEGKKRDNFLKEHHEHQQRLKPHIHRLIARKPLVTASLLQQEGIPPGKSLGLLLKEGERLAINQDLHHADLVIAQLKQSPFWPHLRF